MERMRRQTKWSADWLRQPDQNDQVMETWCRLGDRPGEAFCKLCYKGFSFTQHGIAALRQHAATAKHVSLACPTSDSGHVEKPKQQAAITAFFASHAPTAAGSSSPQLVPQQDRSANLTMRACLRLILLVIKKDLPIRTLDDLVDLLPAAFPDSDIAKAITCRRTKATYLINEALAPHAKATMLQAL